MANKASPNGLLRELERSPLLADDFPKRRRYTPAEWAGLSESERAASEQPSLEAIDRLPESDRVGEIIVELGKARYEPAVPLLSRLWAECAHEPVRRSVSLALHLIGTAEARAALQGSIEDADDTGSVASAVRAFFEADPKAAFEQLAPYFEDARTALPGGTAVPETILGILAPFSYRRRRDGSSQPEWSVPWARRLLERDRRWLDLCVRFRRHPQLGLQARAALAAVEPEVVKVSLAAARAGATPRVLRPRPQAATDLLARYRRGEHEGVWDELRGHEVIDGALREEAVATETMRRVAACADQVAERLAARGWAALTGSLRTPPTRADAPVIARMEKFVKTTLPPALTAFWTVVGGIDFVWDYRLERQPPDLGVDLPLVEMDPLFVEPARRTGHAVEEWSERESPIDPDLNEPFMIDLAPDWYHKADISGGPPYGVEVPFLGADPPFANEAHGFTFVQYLRLAFRWGGFPRLDVHPERDDVRRFVDDMTSRLEPF